MERLEAALAKARAARETALSEAEETSPLALSETDAVSAPLTPEPIADTLQPKADWSALTSLSISTKAITRNRLSALAGGKAAMPYDMLRARVTRQMKDKNWTRLAITSPNPGCGKTTVSLNLAFSLARQNDLRVMLMDFDLRNPSLSKALGQPTKNNMADLLTGEVDFEDFALGYKDNLAICLNQRPVPRSAELLHSRQTQKRLDKLITDWAPDIVVFDLPPLQGNDDTLGFLEQVDSVLLIAAAESTTVSQIDLCDNELSQLTNVMGTVLNKCRYPDAESGYGAGYYY